MDANNNNKYHDKRPGFVINDVEQTIPARFEKQVKRYPGSIAVKCKNNLFTYDSLNRAADRLAQAVLNKHLKKPIAFLIEHSSMQIVSILGILKTGKIFVPLDPSYPQTLLQKMVIDSDAGLIITNNKNMDPAKAIAGKNAQIINIDKIGDITDLENQHLKISPDTFACIHYTSGSTGEPKGVVQNHRNWLHFAMCVTDSWSITADDSIAHITSCSFSASMVTICGALMNGASLNMYDLKNEGLASFAEWLIQEHISIYFSVPSVFRQFAQILSGREKFHDLRLIVFTGETLFRKDVELYQSLFPEKCVARNLLGGSEMHYVASYPIDKKTILDNEVVPPGFGIKDKKILILNDDGSEVSCYISGEIVIKSRYLSPGYWQRPALTEAVFKNNPNGKDERLFLTGDIGFMRPDGCLVHIGRKDFQVKIRGQRVETEAIEAGLSDLDNIKEAAIAAHDDSHGNKYLAAYIVPRNKPWPAPDTLRTSLSEIFPDYMVPSFITILNELPYTQSGKLDRKALPKPDLDSSETDTEYIQPHDELEYQLIKICEEICDIKTIGMKDSFIDLGIDSIRYLRLIMEIEVRFNIRLSAESLPHILTLEDMASLIRMHKRPRFAYGFQKTIYSIITGSFFSSGYKNFNKNMYINKIGRNISLYIMKFFGLLIPFQLSMKILSWLCEMKLIQVLFFQQKIKLIKRLLASIRNPLHEKAVVHLSLLSNFFRIWLLTGLDRLAPNQFDQIVEIKGMSLLHRSNNKGKGLIIAVSHQPFSRIVLFIINRLNFDNIFILGTKPFATTSHKYKKSRRKKVKHYYQNIYTAMHEAISVLKRGGVVIIAPDGYLGSSGVSLPFLGRRRDFQAGFAEIALITGADIVPAFVSIKQNGHFDVEFIDMPDVIDDDMKHQEKVIYLIKQYASLLEARWNEKPENISWQQIKRFFYLPLV